MLPDIVYALPPAGMFLSILAMTGAAALALHLAFLLRPLRRLSEKLSDLSPVVMTLCGTLFVLSVTFLANSVWLIEDRARETVNAEARSIRVMRSYMDQMTGPSRDSFARIIAAYGQAVEAEWPDMREAERRIPAEQQLRDIYSAIIQGFAEGDQNRVLQQRLLAAVDQLSLARQQRLSMAQDVVSGGQWFLVTALGLLLLVVMATGHGRFAMARGVALSAIGLAVSIAIFVIVSHDRPFVGYQALTPRPILAAAGE